MARRLQFYCYTVPGLPKKLLSLSLGFALIFTPFPPQRSQNAHAVAIADDAAIASLFTASAILLGTAYFFQALAKDRNMQLAIEETGRQLSVVGQQVFLQVQQRIDFFRTHSSAQASLT